jgi:hypothetical protein
MAGTNFATAAIRELHVSALAKHVQEAAAAGHASFVKHVAPQLELLVRATHFDVRRIPATEGTMKRIFYGVSELKYKHFFFCFILWHLDLPTMCRFDYKFPQQYAQYSADHAEKEERSPGYWATQSNHTYWSSPLVRFIFLAMHRIFFRNH